MSSNINELEKMYEFYKNLSPQDLLKMTNEVKVDINTLQKIAQLELNYKNDLIK